MDSAFSSHVIEALTQAISGGAGGSFAPGSVPEPIGLYRTGAEIHDFLRDCGIDSSQGQGSRVPALRDCLRSAAQQPNGMSLLRRAIENVADPRAFGDRPEKAEAVRSYLNVRLVPDGFEVVIRGGKAVLQQRGSANAVVGAIAAKSQALDFDTVSQGLERALANAESDPEDAVTAACAMLESVCRSILVEMRQPIPKRMNISTLFSAVQGPLRLSPGRADLSEEVANDVRMVLEGLTRVAKGIGELRTHGGDAHGRERGAPSIDARIARLAVHAASTIALFLIETWQREQQRIQAREVSS